MLIHVGFHLSARDGHDVIAVPASHLIVRGVIVKQEIAVSYQSTLGVAWPR